MLFVNREYVAVYCEAVAEPAGGGCVRRPSGGVGFPRGRDTGGGADRDDGATGFRSIRLVPAHLSVISKMVDVGLRTNRASLYVDLLW